jgi:hypothetical protein
VAANVSASGTVALVGSIYAPPLAGLSVFTVSADEAKAIIEDDPAVRAGYFTFELVPWKTFRAMHCQCERPH